MQNQVVIANNAVSVIEYKNQPVVTFKMIDQLHLRPEGTARKAFNNHFDKFIESDDYFRVSYEEWKNMTAVNNIHSGHDTGQRNDIIFITQSGYLMLVKSFNDDFAWQVQRDLVNRYFGIHIDGLKSLHERLDAQDKKLNLLIHQSMSMSKKQRRSGFKLPEPKVPIESDAEREYYKELIKDAIRAAIQVGLSPSKKVMKNRKKHLKQLKDDEFDSLIDDMLENHQIKSGRNKRVMLYFLD